MKTMKRLAKLQVWSLALAIGMALGLAQITGAHAGPLAQASDPTSVVDAFHAAGDDMEAALALLTEDVVIELRPAPPNTPGVWKGKEGARAFFEWRNANNIRRVRAGDANVAGDRVTGNVGVSSNTFTRLGLGTVGHTFEAQVQDGKLKSYLGQITPEEQTRVAAAILAAGQPQAPPAGMPSTGGPLILPFVFAIGMVFLTTGAALRRRKV